MVAPPPAAVSSDLETMKKTESTLSQLVFPNEFPYEFDSYALTFPGDETSDDEDDFFAGLTRRLALSTQRLPSPPPPFPTVNASEVNATESTRSQLASLTTSGNKSPSGPFSQAPSPPESPARGEDTLIKRTNLDSNPNPLNAAFGSYYYWLQQPPQYHQSPITLQPASIASPFPVSGVFSAPTAATQPSTGTGVFSVAIQPSVGTGVFIPKNHRNPFVSRKKGGSGCVKLPTKAVQTQHVRTETFSGRCNSRSQAGGSTNSNIPNLSSETHFPKLK